MYEDYKIRYMRISRMKYTRIMIFSFQSNEVSVLDHFVPTTFSIYSVELELHDRMVCSVHLC
jgi:hypothetical protein